MPIRDVDEDRSFLARRAREEREASARCEDSAAAMAHLKMAEEYDKRASQFVTASRLAAT